MLCITIYVLKLEHDKHPDMVYNEYLNNKQLVTGDQVEKGYIMIEKFYEESLRDLVATIIEEDGFEAGDINSGEDLGELMEEVCDIIRGVFCDTANDNDMDDFVPCI